MQVTGVHTWHNCSTRQTHLAQGLVGACGPVGWDEEQRAHGVPLPAPAQSHARQHHVLLPRVQGVLDLQLGLQFVGAQARDVHPAGQWAHQQQGRLPGARPPACRPKPGRLCTVLKLPALRCLAAALQLSVIGWCHCWPHAHRAPAVLSEHHHQRAQGWLACVRGRARGLRAVGAALQVPGVLHEVLQRGNHLVELGLCRLAHGALQQLLPARSASIHLAQNAGVSSAADSHCRCAPGTQQGASEPVPARRTAWASAALPR